MPGPEHGDLCRLSAYRVGIMASRRKHSCRGEVHFRYGSNEDQPLTPRNFCFGRKADMVKRLPLPQPRQSSLVDARASDFRYAPNNRHAMVDVGFRRIYFRCWSRSGRGWKALLTAGINP